MALNLDGQFDGTRGYLNTASLGIPPRAALEELRQATDQWGRGQSQPPDYDSNVERARAAFARLNSVPPGQVTVGSHVSYFAGLVAASLQPGDRVVAYRGDFTSLLFPFMSRGDLDLRLVELDQIAAAVGPDTALVAVSSVQSADGRMAALDDIAAAAADHGALTLVDTTQSTGWLALDAGCFDYTVCGAYKWLLSPRGTAFMTVPPRHLDRLRPGAAGWYAGARPWESIYGPAMELAADARRFDLSPAWLCWVGTAPALEYLEAVGIERIHAHDLELADALRDGLGLEPSASALVSVDRPGAAAVLADAGITAAVRDGRVRLGFHLCNDRADVDAALAALA